MRRVLLFGLLLPLLAAPAHANTADVLNEIRTAMEAMRAEYEARISELEKRLAAAESALAAGHASAAAATGGAMAGAAPAPAPRSASRGNAYNPAIGIILQGQYSDYSEDPEGFHIPGFQPGGEAGPAESGLAADHTELLFSANVDDRFYGQVTAAIAQHEGAIELELEEAFVEAGALPGGLAARAGRFFSNIGYLNSRHAHTWDFADQPLPYQALLGSQYYDDGLQLRWLAPTDLFVEAGVEVLRGGGFPAAAHGEDFPGALSASLRVGGDAGEDLSWRAGISRLWADAEDRGADEEGGHDHGHGGGVEPSAFTGDSDLTVVDAVLKWAPGGNSRNTNFKLQAELFRREESGTVSVDDGEEITAYRGNQDGLYVQGIYQFRPRWRVGARYGWLDADNRADDVEVLEEAGLLTDGHEPSRFSLMADWSPSEFSRLRLQYNRDTSQPETDHQWFLQYIMSIGAHGAHEF